MQSPSSTVRQVHVGDAYGLLTSKSIYMLEHASDLRYTNRGVTCGRPTRGTKLHVTVVTTGYCRFVAYLS